ncbi:MAG: hypothetical protein AAB397_02295 [Patescibacteria group bacterium]
MILNFFIKSAWAQSGIGAIGAVPTVGVLYCLFLKILNWFFAFSIVVAIIYTISIGISMMTAGGNVDTKKTALNKLYFTAVGVMVIFASRIIVEQIIPKFLGIGELDIESGGLASGLLDLILGLFGTSFCDILNEISL